MNHPNSFHQQGPGGLSREVILQGEIRNRTQEEKVLSLMKCRPEDPITAEVICNYFPEIFITDARRSLTNLSDKNLIRFVEKVPGSKGVPINSYQLIPASKIPNQLSLL